MLMKNLNKKKLLLPGFLLAIFGVFFGASIVFTQDYGLKATADVAKLTTTGDIPGVIGNVVGAGLSLISVLFFILMIYAGIKWMTARGDEGRAKESLDTIFAAIIGIIIVLAAYAITNFVLSSVKDGVENNTTQTPTACAEKYPGYSCNTDTLCVANTIKTDGLCQTEGTVCCSVSSTAP